MKKSIALILFVLISTLSFSQNSGVILSIDSHAFVSLHDCHPQTVGDPYIRDSVYVKNSTSIITIDFDGLLLKPSHTSNLWIGTPYTFKLNSVIIHSGIVQATGNTFTFSANNSGIDYYKLLLPGDGNISPSFPITSNGEIIQFYITHQNDPFSISGMCSNNQVNFNWSRLLNSNLSSYVYNSSQDAPLAPITGTTTNITNLIYSVTATDTIGYKYLHIRSTDTSKITAWYTYKMKLTYTAPTPTTTVGITENTNAVSGFKVYPNPAKDIITVQYATSNNVETVVLYNIAGQIMSTETVESMGDNKITFNIESYPQGIYFARIGTATYKFIKQ